MLVANLLSRWLCPVSICCFRLATRMYWPFFDHLWLLLFWLCSVYNCCIRLATQLNHPTYFILIFLTFIFWLFSVFTCWIQLAAWFSHIVLVWNFTTPTHCLLALTFWFNGSHFFTQSSEQPFTSILFYINYFWKSLSFLYFFLLVTFLFCMLPFVNVSAFSQSSFFLAQWLSCLQASLGGGSGIVFYVCIHYAPHAHCVANTWI